MNAHLALQGEVKSGPIPHPAQIQTKGSAASKQKGSRETFYSSLSQERHRTYFNGGKKKTNNQVCLILTQNWNSTQYLAKTFPVKISQHQVFRYKNALYSKGGSQQNLSPVYSKRNQDLKRRQGLCIVTQKTV